MFNAPASVSCMRGNPSTCLMSLQESLAKMMVDATVSVADQGPAWSCLSDSQQECVLALRGLLAGKQCVHCLKKRHRVEYGVDRCVRWLLRLGIGSN